MSIPRYRHHCPHCRFLGQHEGYDLYACAQDAVVGTVLLARWADEGDADGALPFRFVAGFADEVHGATRGGLALRGPEADHYSALAEADARWRSAAGTPPVGPAPCCGFHAAGGDQTVACGTAEVRNDRRWRDRGGKPDRRGTPRPARP